MRISTASTHDNLLLTCVMATGWAARILAHFAEIDLRAGLVDFGDERADFDGVIGWSLAYIRQIALASAGHFLGDPPFDP
jgi:hypothetical protein